MDSLREYAARLTRQIRHPRFESEMDEELQFHIQMQTEQFVQEGVPGDEARRRALIQFGGLEQTRENCRDAVGVRVANDLVSDLRYAVRTLVNAPAFTMVAVLTLALGIGANTAVFSVVNALLLEPLPLHEPHRLVMIWQRNPEIGMTKGQVAWGDYFDWRRDNSTLESLGFVVNMTAACRNFGLQVENDVKRIRGRHVSSTLFGVLGVRPMLGRTFDAADDRPGGPRRAVISHSLWTESFDRDHKIIGRLVNVSHQESSFTDIEGDATYEIIGVMPPAFRFPEDAEIWLSVAGWSSERALARFISRRDHHGMWVVGRIRDGVSVQQVQEDLRQIQGRIADDPVNRMTIRLATDVTVSPLLDQVNGKETRPALMLLLGAVVFVLLIACVNVANLLLARAVSRRREIAIRVSLGAGRMRVIRQLLTESILLSFLGAAAGLLVAYGGIGLLQSIQADATYLGVKEFRFNRIDGVEIDRTVLGFTVAVTIATGVVFGLIPALQASRLNVNAALKADGPAATPGRGTRLFRNLLLVSEVALAFVLLVGAGGAIRSYAQMRDVETGMQTDDIIRADFDLETAKRVYETDSKQAFQEAISRVKALPGVISVAGCGEDPFVKSGWNEVFKIIDSPHEDLDFMELPATDVRAMGPGAFQTLGIPLLEGRDFSAGDDENSPCVTIVNDAIRKRFFPNESPIGRTIQMRGWRGHEKTIIGVVGNVRNYSNESVDQPEIYFPFAQSFLLGLEVGPVMAIRHQCDTDALIPVVRQAVNTGATHNESDTDDEVLINFSTMNRILDMSASSERFQTVLLACFAAVALLLAMVGIYGVMAYSTSQRIREFGIRMALGAKPRQIVGMIATEGLLLCGLGIGIGTAVTFMLGRMLESRFFAVESLDMTTMFVATAIVLIIVVATCLIPASKAIRISPFAALRQF